MKPFLRNRETILKHTRRNSLVNRDAERVQEAQMNHSIHSADRSYAPEDRGCRPGGGHRGRGFRHLRPYRRGLQPDRAGREGRQGGGGRHQLEHLDGPLNDIYGIGIKAAASRAAFLFAAVSEDLRQAIETMAREFRELEPAASAVTGRRSNQLSYSRGCRNHALIRADDPHRRPTTRLSTAFR